MGIIVNAGQGPVSLPVANAAAVYEGFLYKDNGSGVMTVCTTVNDSVVAVCVESSVDPEDATAQTLYTGDSAKFAMLGSGMIVGVASVTANTYAGNVAVYNNQTAGTDGHCSNSSASTATKIGHYAGKAAYVTATAGEKIPVRLDVKPIA